jgi:Tol biopolymer transport system component
MLIAAVMLVGCGTTPTLAVTPRPTTDAQDATAESVEPTPTSEIPTATPPPTVDVQALDNLPDGQNLLVALTTGSAPGQIALMDRAATAIPVMDIPADASRVTPCGDEATSPNGRFFAFYMGGDAGNLYLMDATKAPVRVDDVEYLVCLGNGTFQFTPDSNRFAYIDFFPGVTREEYPDGVLKIFETGSGSQIVTFDNVTTFDINNGNAVFVSFFVNNRNEADEAAVSLWDGSATREIATLLPTAERCWFTSAAISFAPNGSAVLVMGQRCAAGNVDTQWQLFTLDPSAGSATLAASDFQPGAFVPFARNNNVFFSPDGSYAYFTVPDGVTAYTVAVAAVQLADITITVPVARQAVFPNFSGATNAFPRFSPDHRWLATAVTSPDNDNQVLALDLANPATAPITIGAGSRDDLISGLAFTPDSGQVIYTAGGAGGADNALLALNLASGSERRIMRGHFDRDVLVSPDSNTAALLDWQRVEDPREPMYTNLVLINLVDSTVTTLFTGADVVDGRVTNVRTAAPLTWR